MKERIISRLRESADIKLRFAKESVAEVEEAASTIIKSLKSGGKVLIFGNGGSAADSQHIAAEFVNRYSRERKALPALALTTDSSILTSIPNDGSFEDEREIGKYIKSVSNGEGARSKNNRFYGAGQGQGRKDGRLHSERPFQIHSPDSGAPHYARAHSMRARGGVLCREKGTVQERVPQGGTLSPV